MKKLTWKGLVMSLIPLIAAVAVFLANLYSGSLNFFHFGAYGGTDGATIAQFTFLFLFLLGACAIVVLSVIALFLGDKPQFVMHLIALIGAIALSAALFLTCFIVSIIAMAEMFHYSEYYGAWYMTTFVFVRLLSLAAAFIPLALSAFLTVMYFVLRKKLPQSEPICKAEAPVSDEVNVDGQTDIAAEPADEMQSLSSENID